MLYSLKCDVCASNAKTCKIRKKELKTPNYERPESSCKNICSKREPFRWGQEIFAVKLQNKLILNAAEHLYNNKQSNGTCEKVVQVWRKQVAERCSYSPNDWKRGVHNKVTHLLKKNIVYNLKIFLYITF